MKNRRIIQAYDSVNPCVEEKQRMLDAILADTPVENPVRRKRPVQYSAKAAGASRSGLWTGIAACVAVLLISAFALSHMRRQLPEDPVLAAPTTEQISVTVNTSYIPVLDKYRAALREGWSREQCEIEGISTRFYLPEPVDFTIGKRMLDINRDGRTELLIGHDNLIWDLYTTLEDGTPIQLLSDVQDGWQFYVSREGILSAEYYSKDDCYVEYYRLEDNRLVMERQLQYVDGQWSMETAEQEWVRLTEGEVRSITNDFDYMTPDWIPLDDEALKMDPDTVERYMLTLEKFKTAIAEGWTEEQCLMADISRNISPQTSSLGWCLMDVDNNGIQELIISNGNSIHDLYTLQDGVPVHVLSSTDTNNFTLCDNGIFQEQVIADQNTYWYYFKLSAGKQELQGVLAWNNRSKTYAYGPNEKTLSDISKEEAGPIIFAHQAMDLKLTPFVSGQFGQAKEIEAYDPLIGIYRQALAEKWDMEQCSENDISLMISRFTEQPENISALLMDLDGDGMNELVITDGMMIYDLYTLKNGEPVKLLTGWERNAYRLCVNNVIFNQGSNSAASSVFNYYRVMAGELVLVDSVIFDAGKDPENPWFHSSDGMTPEEPLTEEAASYIMDSYPDVTILGTNLLELS